MGYGPTKEEMEQIMALKKAKGFKSANLTEQQIAEIGFQNSGDLLDDEDKKLIAKIGKAARDYQYEFRGCAQTTLKALQENLGIKGSDTFKAASALAGGIASKGKGSCGALVGGVLALGLEFGRADFAEDGPPRRRGVGVSNFKVAYDLSGELYESFKKVYFGEIICNEIQKHVYGAPVTGAVSSDPDIIKAKEDGVYWSMIAEEARWVTEVAARLTAEIILRERKKKGKK